MAFRQIIIDMDGFRATELLNVTSLDYNPGTLWSRPFTDGTDLYSKATSENVPVTLFDTGIFKMVATLTDSLKHLNKKFYYNQNQIINNNSGNRYIEFTGFAFGVDDDTELGTLWICVTADGGEYGVTRLASPSHDLYLGILSAQPDPNKSGGAGSGYIGNSLLSNKKMVGYNVPTSSAESTKTESVNEASETPVSGKPKIGNGFARIKFLRDVQILTLEQITNGGQISEYTTISGDYTWNATPPWSEMDGRILFLKKYNGRPLQYDSNGGYFYFERKSGDSESNFYIPIPVRMKVTKITFDWMNSYRPTEWTRLGVKLEDTNQQAVDLVDFLDAQVMSDYASYSKEFNSPVYANYVLFFAWDGEYKIKNFKIYGSA